jgi:uncharacterized protein (DUF433 family)
MTLAIEREVVPLAPDPGGVIRVGRTRVTLDTVVGAFNEGATPEEIVQQYASLALGDVYAVITFYLRRRQEVDAYLREREVQRAAIQAQSEARDSPVGIRQRLLARRAS